MDTSQEHNPEEASQAEPTIEEIKRWNKDKLLEWIHRKRPGLLEDDNLETFKKAFIRGSVFLKYAGDVGFFENKCNLPIGISDELADLAKEVKKRNRQQAEDVEMSDNISVASSTEPNPVRDEYTCLREHTVERLAEILDQEWVVLVRGTPSSGKTTLARLLRDYYEKHGVPVIFLRGWKERKKGATSYLTTRCKSAGYRGIKIDAFSNDPNVNIVFILDEAQQSYSDVDLWDFIKAKNDQHRGPRFCLFSSYGSPSEGMVEARSFTPPFLGPTKRVSIIRSRVPNSPDICLFYNDTEFEDVVEKYCANETTRLEMDRGARAYLFEITSGHPGAVGSMLSYIFKIYGSDIKNHRIQEITEDHLVKALNDDAAVFQTLLSSAVYRSFPTQDKLTPLAVGVLGDVLQNGKLKFDLEDGGMKLCFEKGWIQVEAECPDGSNQVCFLPSQLHRKYVEYYIAFKYPKPFPIHRFPHLPELCKEVLKHFSKKSLLLNSAERGPPTAAPRPVEAQYCDEFYRVFKSLLGNGVSISSEWGRSRSGRIDFRILGPKWGVEFLIDGTMTTLNEHYRRFLPGGKYHWWILDGLMSDWVVIDCRCSIPPGTTPPWRNLWHAVFAEDFSTLRILDAGNQEIMPKVCLMN